MTIRLDLYICNYEFRLIGCLMWVHRSFKALYECGPGRHDTSRENRVLQYYTMENTVGKTSKLRKE